MMTLGDQVKELGEALGRCQASATELDAAVNQLSRRIKILAYCLWTTIAATWALGAYLLFAK